MALRFRSWVLKGANVSIGPAPVPSMAGERASSPRFTLSKPWIGLPSTSVNVLQSTLAGHAGNCPHFAMKVSFTTREYARLLELVHLGLSMAGARPDDSGAVPERYNEIAQKVFGLAEAFGCADLVATDGTGQLFLADTLVAGPVGEKIDRFVESVFWSELVARLAERDFQSELGVTELSDKLSADERERLGRVEDSYWREFEARGVDNLILLRGGKG